MTASAALTRGRALAEKLMVDACAITRGGTATTNRVTGQVTRTPTTVYSGPCRVQQRTAQATLKEAGEQHIGLLQLELQLPMSVTGLAEGDRVAITASEHDPDLVDRVFLIRDLAHKTHATARRVGVEEET